MTGRPNITWFWTSSVWSQITFFLFQRVLFKYYLHSLILFRIWAADGPSQVRRFSANSADFCRYSNDTVSLDILQFWRSIWCEVDSFLFFLRYDCNIWLFSQPHRHFQTIFFEDQTQIPWEHLIINNKLPFMHKITRSTQPETLFQSYVSFLDNNISASYNLLLTRDWLLLVPRRKPSFIEGVVSLPSINALGCTGMILVKSLQELEQRGSYNQFLRDLYAESFYPLT